MIPYLVDVSVSRKSFLEHEITPAFIPTTVFSLLTGSRSNEEKLAIETKAAQVAGAEKVTDQIDIAAK